MNETYLIMAKTVEEAIAIANREYAKDGKEVSYEILEMPKKGFLGIGARDAKIKVTVTESESSKIGSELSSIVADLRSMKVHTNRGGSEGEEKPKKQNVQAQGQKKQTQQNGGNGQKQGQKPQGQSQKQGQAQKSAEAKPQKQDGKPAEAKQGQKPAEPRKDKPAEPKKQQAQPPKHEGQPQPKAAKPQNPQNPQGSKPEPKKQNEPKPERQPKADAKPEKPAESRKPQEPKEPREPKEPKPQAAEPVKEPVVPAEPAVQPEPVVSEAAAEPVAEPAEEPAKAEYKSSLNNQAKPQRRQKTPKSPNADAVPGAEAIIAAPVGLTDFTREANGDTFGEGSESGSSGRMSNDIRKKPRQPKRADKPQEAPAEQETREEVVSEAPEATEAIEAAEDILAVADAMMSETEPADADEAAETADEAAEAPVVEEDRQKVGVTEAEMQYALDFTNTLLRNMAIDATASRVECPEGEEYVIEGDANVYPKINIDGNGTGILIGHHGETLDAVQYLVNLAALRQSKQKGGDYVKIVVDIENYRAKREETLRSLARRMAARAVKYKRNVFLEPMNAYERRIIHSELHSFENVSTHSVGADKNRKIIITYEGPDKAPVQPRREKEERADRPERGEKREGRPESRGSASRRGEKENRRPKKIQKMPIEKLPDFLAPGTTEDTDTFVEIED